VIKVRSMLANTNIAMRMYYIGIDPFTKQQVYGARHLRD
jgi:hypothetical protein